MQISSILAPAAVRFASSVTSKKRLFQDLADIAHGVYGLSTATAFDGLQERESLGPTGVGHGVALPHARVPDLDRVVGVFLRLEKAIDFGAVDRLPVDLVFALFAPVDSGVDHLKALATVSRTLRDPAICQKLRANEDPLALHALLTEQTATKAA
jgi:PTS system nitrogen regulatory IIA component